MKDYSIIYFPLDDVPAALEIRDKLLQESKEVTDWLQKVEDSIDQFCKPINIPGLVKE